MTQPSPDPSGASHGSPDPTHLACACQDGSEDPVAFCGTGIDRLLHDGLDPPDADLVWCVVCWDLARTAVVARRCERCTS